MWWLLVAVALGLPMLLFGAGFIIGCFEKNPVRMFAAAPPPADVPPYVKVMLQHAASMGFTWRGHGEHTKYGPKLQAELMLSADLFTLAIVGQGHIAGMPSKKTILLGQFDDGSMLVTVDEAGIAELDPNTRRNIVMNADFEELVRAHYDELQRSPAMAVPFPADADWSVVDAIYRARTDRIVERGLARYCDLGRERFCYTPIGSFRATIVHGIVQLLNPSSHLRAHKRRPG